MRNARVGLFDEHSELRQNIYPKFLKRAGHAVVFSAGCAGDAWVGLQGFEGEMNVALVDFDPGPHRPDEHEAEMVIELLREKYQETVKIVSVNSSGQTPEGADDHIEKIDLPGAFIEYIEKLPDRG